jgi:hypothetical protein
LPSGAPIELLERGKYPEVQFWTKGDYKNFMNAKDMTSFKNETGICGKTRVSHGENVSSLYLEDEKGNPITGHKLTEMRALA